MYICNFRSDDKLITWRVNGIKKTREIPNSNFKWFIDDDSFVILCLYIARWHTQRPVMRNNRLLFVTLCFIARKTTLIDGKHTVLNKNGPSWRYLNSINTVTLTVFEYDCARDTAFGVLVQLICFLYKSTVGQGSGGSVEEKCIALF